MNTYLSEFETPCDLHADTADLVARFAQALAAKLMLAQEKHGYLNNWAHPNSDEHRTELAKCIMKGDPLDVAAYAAFLWHHGETTRAAHMRWNIEGPHDDGSISICFGRHDGHEGCRFERFTCQADVDRLIARAAR